MCVVPLSASYLMGFDVKLKYHAQAQNHSDIYNNCSLSFFFKKKFNLSKFYTHSKNSLYSVCCVLSTTFEC